MTAKRRKAPTHNTGPDRLYEPEDYMPQICKLLETGMTLNKACATVGGPSFPVVIKWTHWDDKWKNMYHDARKIGYAKMADELLEIADTQVADEFDQNGKPVKRRFDQIDTQMTKFRIDTRKWILAKMLPKVYGDRVVTEHVGADGGPMQIAAMDFKGLSTDELTALQKLLAKASA